MPGARPPPQKPVFPPQKPIAGDAEKQQHRSNAIGTLKDMGRALAQAQPIVSLEKKSALTRTALSGKVDHVSTVLFYCSVNAALSASLISFNKYLMNEAHFPYPVPLVVLHTSASSIFVGLFLFLQRGCYDGRVGDSAWFSGLGQALCESSLKTKVLGLGALFAVQLAFSNAAYLYSSIVFIQLMKEGNLVFVYALSVFVALEAVHWQRVRVLLFIVLATLLTIKGEMHFTWIGFVIQLIGQGFEGMRIVLQALVLNAKGLNMDVLTYMLLVMPVCAAILISALVFNHCVWQVRAIAVPPMETIIVWAPMLIVNALIAVALNFSTALVVKHTSAVGLILSGIMKDTAIVVGGCVLLGESISSIQVAGFGMQIVGILIYSLLKNFPDMFTDGIPLGMKRLLGIEVNHISAGEDSRYGATQT